FSSDPLLRGEKAFRSSGVLRGAPMSEGLLGPGGVGVFKGDRFLHADVPVTTPSTPQPPVTIPANFPNIAGSPMARPAVGGASQKGGGQHAALPSTALSPPSIRPSREANAAVPSVMIEGAEEAAAAAATTSQSFDSGSVADVDMSASLSPMQESAVAGNAASVGNSLLATPEMAASPLVSGTAGLDLQTAAWSSFPSGEPSGPPPSSRPELSLLDSEEATMMAVTEPSSLPDQMPQEQWSNVDGQRQQAESLARQRLAALSMHVASNAGGSFVHQERPQQPEDWSGMEQQQRSVSGQDGARLEPQQHVEHVLAAVEADTQHMEPVATGPAATAAVASTQAAADPGGAVAALPQRDTEHSLRLSDMERARQQPEDADAAARYRAEQQAMLMQQAQLRLYAQAQLPLYAQAQTAYYVLVAQEQQKQRGERAGALEPAQRGGDAGGGGSASFSAGFGGGGGSSGEFGAGAYSHQWPELERHALPQAEHPLVAPAPPVDPVFAALKQMPAIPPVPTLPPRRLPNVDTATSYASLLERVAKETASAEPASSKEEAKVGAAGEGAAGAGEGGGEVGFPVAAAAAAGKGDDDGAGAAPIEVDDIAAAAAADPENAISAEQREREEEARVRRHRLELIVSRIRRRGSGGFAGAAASDIVGMAVEDNAAHPLELAVAAPGGSGEASAADAEAKELREAEAAVPKITAYLAACKNVAPPLIDMGRRRLSALLQQRRGGALGGEPAQTDGSGGGGGGGDASGVEEDAMAVWVKQTRAYELGEWREWCDRTMGEGRSADVAGLPLPPGLSPRLAGRALGAYSLLRTLSRNLHLAPFHPYAFLRALALDIPTPLVDEVHLALVRVLGGPHSHRVHHVEARSLFDWRFLDTVTWPAFLVQLMEGVEHIGGAGRDADEEGSDDESDEDSGTDDDDEEESAANGRRRSGRRGSSSKDKDKDGGGNDAGDGVAVESDDGDKDGDEELKPIQEVCEALKRHEHHALPVEAKLDALEWLLDRCLEAEWLVAEVDFRLHTPPDQFIVDEDGTVFNCIICDSGGNLICCDRCPRAYHVKCVSGRSGTEMDNWACFECALPEPSADGCRVASADSPLGKVWVLGGGYVFSQMRGAAAPKGLGGEGMELLTPQEVWDLGWRLGRDAAAEPPFKSIVFPESCFVKPPPPLAEVEEAEEEEDEEDEAVESVGEQPAAEGEDAAPSTHGRGRARIGRDKTATLAKGQVTPRRQSAAGKKNARRKISKGSDGGDGASDEETGAAGSRVSTPQPKAAPRSHPRSRAGRAALASGDAAKATVEEDGGTAPATPRTAATSPGFVTSKDADGVPPLAAVATAGVAAERAAAELGEDAAVAVPSASLKQQPIAAADADLQHEAAAADARMADLAHDKTSQEASPEEVLPEPAAVVSSSSPGGAAAVAAGVISSSEEDGPVGAPAEAAPQPVEVQDKAAAAATAPASPAVSLPVVAKAPAGGPMKVQGTGAEIPPAEQLAAPVPALPSLPPAPAEAPPLPEGDKAWVNPLLYVNRYKEAARYPGMPPALKTLQPHFPKWAPTYAPAETLRAPPATLGAAARLQAAGGETALGAALLPAASRAQLAQVHLQLIPAIGMLAGFEKIMAPGLVDWEGEWGDARELHPRAKSAAVASALPPGLGRGPREGRRWLDAVSAATSVPELAALTTRFADAVHWRAFRAAWHLSGDKQRKGRQSPAGAQEQQQAPESARPRRLVRGFDPAVGLGEGPQPAGKRRRQSVASGTVEAAAVEAAATGAAKGHLHTPSSFSADGDADKAGSAGERAVMDISLELLEAANGMKRSLSKALLGPDGAGPGCAPAGCAAPGAVKGAADALTPSGSALREGPAPLDHAPVSPHDAAVEAAPLPPRGSIQKGKRSRMEPQTPLSVARHGLRHDNMTDAEFERLLNDNHDDVNVGKRQREAINAPSGYYGHGIRRSEWVVSRSERVLRPRRGLEMTLYSYTLLYGRRCFAPERQQSLPPALARCGGRLGGHRFIPGVNSERLSLRLAWRNRTMHCRTLPELALHMRTLDFCLDHEAVAAARAAQRNGTPNNATIREARYDSRLMSTIYRVDVPQAHAAGGAHSAWRKEENVDLGLLWAWGLRQAAKRRQGWAKEEREREEALAVEAARAHLVHQEALRVRDAALQGINDEYFRLRVRFNRELAALLDATVERGAPDVPEPAVTAVRTRAFAAFVDILLRQQAANRAQESPRRAAPAWDEVQDSVVSQCWATYEALEDHALAAYAGKLRDLWGQVEVDRRMRAGEKQRVIAEQRRLEAREARRLEKEATKEEKKREKAAERQKLKDERALEKAERNQMRSEDKNGRRMPSAHGAGGMALGWPRGGGGTGFGGSRRAGSGRVSSRGSLGGGGDDDEDCGGEIQWRILSEANLVTLRGAAVAQEEAGEERAQGRPIVSVMLTQRDDASDKLYAVQAEILAAGEALRGASREEVRQAMNELYGVERTCGENLLRIEKVLKQVLMVNRQKEERKLQARMVQQEREKQHQRRLRQLQQGAGFISPQEQQDQRQLAYALQQRQQLQDMLQMQLRRQQEQPRRQQQQLPSLMTGGAADGSADQSVPGVGAATGLFGNVAALGLEPGNVSNWDADPDGLRQAASLLVSPRQSWQDGAQQQQQQQQQQRGNNLGPTAPLQGASQFAGQGPPFHTAAGGDDGAPQGAYY
ncbi:unnamed protein product, partial [Phaeothamnion confervicola]